MDETPELLEAIRALIDHIPGGHIDLSLRSKQVVDPVGTYNECYFEYEITWGDNDRLSGEIPFSLTP